MGDVTRVGTIHKSQASLDFVNSRNKQPSQLPNYLIAIGGAVFGAAFSALVADDSTARLLVFCGIGIVALLVGFVWTYAQRDRS